MLKDPVHQVAGHHACDGKLGPLVDDSGNFYKPFQSRGRGTDEEAFYRDSIKRIPCHIRRYFPAFRGTLLQEASNGSGPLTHLVLQNLTLNHLNLTVMDIKIGARTWFTGASPEYFQKCLKKDRESTSVALGFRISGLQVYGNEESGYWKPGRESVANYSVEDVRLVLRKFVSSSESKDSNLKPDCRFASTVYGGPNGVLAQLLELKAWFEDQTMFHFHSVSVLMVFEKATALRGENSGEEVKLIDFAHVLDGKGVIDYNFLGGLCSLIKVISEILTSSDESTPEPSMQVAEKNQLCFTNGGTK